MLLESSAHCYRLILQRLQDKVADDATVVHVHTRTKRIEDPSDANLNALLKQNNTIAKQE